jgi:hypothetical protein
LSVTRLASVTPFFAFLVAMTSPLSRTSSIASRDRADDALAAISLWAKAGPTTAAEIVNARTDARQVALITPSPLSELLLLRHYVRAFTRS